MAVNVTEIRVWTLANRLARRAYYADRAVEESAAPKTERRYGMAVGICDRCGIDSTQLTREKCRACHNYLWRRANHVVRVRQCPTCERPHTRPGRICGACSARAYRERKKA